MTVNRFEDLEVWQKARTIVNLIYRFTGDDKFSKDYSLKDQMRRAAVSLMANIAEGFSRRTDKEFGQFLFIAKSSAAELQSHAYVALDQGYLTKGNFEQVYNEIDHESRMLSRLITHLVAHHGLQSNREQHKHTRRTRVTQETLRTR